MENDKQSKVYNSMTSQGAYLLKFTKDFITDEPVLFMQQQTPFLISYQAVKSQQPSDLYRVDSLPHESVFPPLMRERTRNENEEPKTMFRNSMSNMKMSLTQDLKMKKAEKIMFHSIG